jgi:hypothetical protein
MPVCVAVCVCPWLCVAVSGQQRLKLLFLAQPPTALSALSTLMLVKEFVNAAEGLEALFTSCCSWFKVHCCFITILSIAHHVLLPVRSQYSAAIR